MNDNTNRLTRLGMYVIPAVAILVVIAWFTVSQPPATDRPGVETADVNPDAFTDQGRLAFVRDGLLYIFDGETGKVHQLTDSGRASQPIWSHDGEWLAFISVADTDADTGPLWLARRDGTRARPVEGLAEPVGPGCFSWSPAAPALAVSMPDGVWLAPAEGEARLLTPVEGVHTVVWSPDGQSLAYNGTLPADEPESRSDALYTLAVDGGAPVQHLTAARAGIRVAAWWPDGKGLLYRVAPLHSASIAADGLSLLSLAGGDTEPRFLATGLAYPEWLSLSPRGDLLMVTGNARIAWTRKDLALINPRTGDVRHLESPADSVAIDPAFAADGTRIAFVAAADLGDEVWGFGDPEEVRPWVATRTLWVADADASEARPLTSAGAGVYQPAWSRDGQHILYVRDNALWIIAAEGGEPERVAGLNAAPQELFGFYGFVSFRNMFAWYQPD